MYVEAAAMPGPKMCRRMRVPRGFGRCSENMCKGELDSPNENNLLQQQKMRYDVFIRGFLRHPLPLKCPPVVLKLHLFEYLIKKWFAFPFNFR